MSRYRYMQLGPGNRITDGIKSLIIMNVIVYVIMLFEPFRNIFIYYFSIIPYHTWSKLHIWQPITYMFLHGGFFHILLNMFGLWMFGTELEMIWGKKQFLRYFFITGIGAGIVSIVVQPTSTIPIIGASGAIYGILLAYGMEFPERTVYIYGLFPIKVKYLVLIFGGIEFFASIRPVNDGIAHYAHLSGMVIGYLYLRYFMKSNHFGRNIFSLEGIKKIFNDLIIHINTKKKNKSKMKKSQMKIDDILEKLSREGYEKLTKEEKNKLAE